MFFSINSSNFNRVFLTAKRTILLYPEGINEIVLNRYLYKKYSTNLKLACVYLLKKATWHTEGNKVVLTFLDKKDDLLASLITYGNGKMQGSKILFTAFNDA